MNGVLIYDLVRDPLGHKHRVHKVCTPDALEDGAIELLPPDAEAPPTARRLK